MTMPHLDDEALSAALDGEATAAESAHLATCLLCRADLESLASVARVVGTPVSPQPASAVDMAVARALRGPTSEATPPPPRAVRERESLVDPAAGRAHHSLRWLPAAAGVAAAVIVVAGAVALLGRVHTTSNPTTAGLAQQTTAAPAFGRAPSTTVNPALEVPHANPPRSSAAEAVPRDLGDQDNPVVLGQLVTAVLNAQPPPTSALAKRLAPPTAGAPSCLTQAVSSLGPIHSAMAVLRYSAPVRWRGQPAVVIVLSDSTGLFGQVRQSGDCALLALLAL